MSINYKSKYNSKYIEPLKPLLKEYAEDVGIYSNEEDFRYAEAYSRKAGEEVLWDINKKVELVQKHLSCRYDILLFSASTIRVEVKCRGCSIDEYPTTDISEPKGNFISDRDGWLIVLFNEGYDYLVFDLTTDCFTTGGEWTHSKQTVGENKNEITEGKYCFDPAKAIYRGKLDKKWITRGGYGREA